MYDYTVEPHGKDLLVEAVNQAMLGFSAAMVPGKWAVDMLPFIERLPKWLPGSGYKRTASQYRQNLMDVVETPYKFAIDRMSSGDVRKSFVSRSTEQARQEKTLDTEAEHAIKWSAASMYTGTKLKDTA